MLAVAASSRWPHVVVPWRLRLPLPVVGWGFLAVLLISGLAAMARGDFGTLLAVKLGLVALFALIQVGLTRRPAVTLIFANFGLILIIVVLSGLLLRV